MSGAKSILVTDGEARSALASVRSLGRGESEVHVLSSSSGALAGVSRYADAVHSVPDPAKDPAGWTEAVEALLTRLPDPLLLPVTEIAMGNVYASSLDERYRVASPPPDAYAKAVDKQLFLEASLAVGFDAPRSIVLGPDTSISDVARELGFPFVLKSRQSRWLVSGRWQSGIVTTIRNEADLREVDLSIGGELLAQEWVPGRGEGLFFLADQGRMVVCCGHRRLREKPPSGGVSTLSESVAPDPALRDMLEALVRDLEWHGVGMLELRRGRGDDGRERVVVMELNPRLWGSLQLAIDAGVDFPVLLDQLHRGESVSPVKAKAGVKLRWLLGDFDHVLIALRSASQREALGYGRLGVIGAFFRSFVDARLELFRMDDWRPFGRALANWFRGQSG
ncbi:MAG: hypothetical protein AB8G23_01665 [Myxococcota bacterium]